MIRKLMAFFVITTSMSLQAQEISDYKKGFTDMAILQSAAGVSISSFLILRDTMRHKSFFRTQNLLTPAKEQELNKLISLAAGTTIIFGAKVLLKTMEIVEELSH